MPAGLKKTWCESTSEYVGDMHQEAKRRPKGRCPKCNRRLTLRAIYCIGGEFIGYKLPEHKEKK